MHYSTVTIPYMVSTIVDNDSSPSTLAIHVTEQSNSSSWHRVSCKRPCNLHGNLSLAIQIDRESPAKDNGPLSMVSRNFSEPKTYRDGLDAGPFRASTATKDAAKRKDKTNEI